MLSRGLKIPRLTPDCDFEISQFSHRPAYVSPLHPQFTDQYCNSCRLVINMRFHLSQYVFFLFVGLLLVIGVQAEDKEPPKTLQIGTLHPSS